MTPLHSLIALTAGFILDLILGDPYSFPHPVKAIGRLIARTENFCRKLFPATPSGERRGGAMLVLVVLLLSVIVPLAVLTAAYRLHAVLGLVLESVLCYQLLAAKCLRQESMKVYASLQKDEVEGARQNVSMIVGRDTKVLDESGIVKAAVETVAENTSDGVIAPLFYMALGGGVLGIFYKAVNTMDSMVGYKNERYLHFGRTAAKLDDAVNYLPARISALLMILAAFLTGMNGKNAFRIWRRDRKCHASPNAGQTEAVCAGALEVQLAGDAWYFGKLVPKKTIGDPIRPVHYADIKRANRLLYGTAVLAMALTILLKGACIYLI